VKVRTLLVSILGFTLVIAGAVAWMFRPRSTSRQVADVSSASAPRGTRLGAAPADSVTAERERRTTAVIEVAPGPVPSALPLIGDKDATGPDGYPLAYVDRPALRSLVWHRRFPEATRYLTEFEDAFEADPKRELWPSDAADAFTTSDASLREQLDMWVASSAGSFAPLLARGMYLLDIGTARRGSKWAADTPAADMKAMEGTLVEARRDLEAALAIRPRLVVALRNLIRLAAFAGTRDERDRFVARAIEVCPSCFLPRGTYLAFLSPRWGGTYEAMQAFAARADPANNPRFRWLPGYAERDRADAARRAKNLDEAEAAIERALAPGEFWLFLRERAKIREARGDAAGALADIERALSQRPGEPELLFERAGALARLKRWEEAAAPLLAGLRVDAASAEGRWAYDMVLKGLDWQGWEYAKAARREDALRLYALALELAPNDRMFSRRRAGVILGKDPDIPSLEEAVKKGPDDFQAHLALDYALAQKREFSRVADMWTDYLSRHPDDARAHLERSGTYTYMQKKTEALADAAKACEFGSSAGCTREKMLQARP
jgi:tetratricopeptide (TPR) repeat protein